MGRVLSSAEQGWFYGLRDGLKPPGEATGILDDSKTALVIAAREKRLKDFVAEQFPETTTVQRKDPRLNRTAIYQGFLAGRETKIHKPLTRSGEQLALC